MVTVDLRERARITYRRVFDFRFPANLPGTQSSSLTIVLCRGNEVERRKYEEKVNDSERKRVTRSIMETIEKRSQIDSRSHIGAYIARYNRENSKPTSKNDKDTDSDNGVSIGRTSVHACFRTNRSSKFIKTKVKEVKRKSNQRGKKRDRREKYRAYIQICQ